MAARSSPSPISPARAPISLATFNLHGGVDGWGRPFAVPEACARAAVDVLVLQEDWRPEGAQSLADEVASELGYDIVTHALARARRAGSGGGDFASGRWGPTYRARGTRATFFVEGPRPLPARTLRSARYRRAGTGSVGIAILTRLPIVDSRVLDLGRLPRDPARRAALLVQINAGGTVLTVAGTHMPHLNNGSPLQLRRLARSLERYRQAGPVVIAGDMNLWGPPVSALMPGWRRAVKGRTWPAWHPHSQIDHILVTPDVTVTGADVLAFAGSDHRPVRAELLLAPSPHLVTTPTVVQ